MLTSTCESRFLADCGTTRLLHKNPSLRYAPYSTPGTARRMLNLSHFLRSSVVMRWLRRRVSRLRLHVEDLHMKPETWNLKLASREAVGFAGKIVFDASKPDGMPRKLLDVSRMNALGRHVSSSLQDEPSSRLSIGQGTAYVLRPEDMCRPCVPLIFA